MKKVKKEGEVRFTVELSEKEALYIRGLIGSLIDGVNWSSEGNEVTIYSLYADFCRMLNEE